MSEEKKNVETEEVKEARELTDEEIAQVSGGMSGAIHHVTEIRSELEIE